MHGQRFALLAEPLVWAVAKIMVLALFLSGHRKVILDATNLTQKRRDEWKSDQWKTVVHAMCVNKEECIRRATAIGDTEIIPVIERMAASSEPLGDYELLVEY